MTTLIWTTQHRAACVVILVSGLVAAGLNSSWAQSARTKTKTAAKNLPELEDDYFKYAVPLTGNASPIAVDKTVSLFQSNGKSLLEMRITDTQLGKDSETIKQFSIEDADGKKKQKLASSMIVRIRSDDRDFDVAYDPAKKGHVLVDVTQRDLDVNERLKAKGLQLWKEQTDEERAKTIADYKTFLQRVQASSQRPMSLTETRFFLFLTDIPPNQVAPYIANLDAMYVELCKAFGIPSGKNIWLGKCIIVACADKVSFTAFEEKFMNNPNAAGAAGINHSSTDGRALISCVRGDSPAAFAKVMVHETAHGFLHRLRSNVGIIRWINEGVAEWVASTIVKGTPDVPKVQKEAVEFMRQTGSLGKGFFLNETPFTFAQYGISLGLTNFMLQIDPGRYRAFILGIKEGYTEEESLKRSYGVTIDELISNYGRSVGVPNLRP